MLLTLIDGTGLPIPPDRTPTGHYVHVYTPYGQYNTVKAAMVNSGVSWNQTLTIHERPQTFSKWLMSIFKSKTVHLEIRASYDSAPTLDQYEVETDSIGVVDGQPVHSAAAVRSPDRPASSSKREEKTVVIFGETGSGKSSVINVIAQKQVAATSNDALGCTSEPKRYPVEISGQKFVLFDTAGLNEGTAGTKGVPIVVVVTGLESESPMESWWDSHKEKFSSLHLAGHACVTTIQDYPGIPEDHSHRVAQSGEILRDLVKHKCSAVAVDDSFSAGKWCWSPSPSMY
ncbi:hypothetical protein CY34DRAFT_104280 [Suillus luteus UH-Slu-Lm8-n1]|uniref:G domain-containing protein n=1 Tax=Suillus luteus UH-Slu-Lm8-n1 TaxID=930992 RepID=A0A0D0ACL9_9AGAM|nr:hypothetical protein CY34DRAFT_104280 [Suillus luteus UH-Slu-Lm8-n1]